MWAFLGASVGARRCVGDELLRGWFVGGALRGEPQSRNDQLGAKKLALGRWFYPQALWKACP